MLRKRVSADRQDFDDALTQSDVLTLVNDRSLRVLQTSAPIDDATWNLLDERFLAQRPDVELRVYGFYGLECDLSFVRNLRHVRRFAADCLSNASHVDAVCSLRGIHSLSLGIYNLESFEFLSGFDGSSICELMLGATESAKPSLRAIGGLKNLERLYVEGPRKDIEIIGGLSNLRKLTLRSCALASLAFLRDLPNLRALEIKLGSVANLAEIAALKELRYLEAWRVRGLSDLSPISEATGLQFLFLQSLKHVSELPDFSQLDRLRRVYLESMSGLTDLKALETAPALEELICVSASPLSPAHFSGLLQKGTLKGLSVGFGSDRKNKELETMIEKAGLQKYRHTEFKYL